jgi:hypothetical protein
MMDFLIENYLANSLNLSSNKIKLLLNHPTESRFKALFEYNRQKKKKRKTMNVNPRSIMLGLDKRTSIIIKNISDDLDEIQFKKIVFTFSKDIDFFYIPKTIKTRKNLRVAFVNVLNFKQIVPIYMGLLYKMKFIYSSPKIQMEICYSKVQGKELLMKRFFPNEMINLNHIKNC